MTAPSPTADILIEKLFDFVLQRLIGFVSLDVLAAGMNVADNALAVDQETDARPGALRIIEPPAAKGSPVATRLSGSYDQEGT